MMKDGTDWGGVIYKPGTREPVRGATVTLYDLGTLTPGRMTTTTDEKGYWRIEKEGLVVSRGPFWVIMQVGSWVGTPDMFQLETVVYKGMWSDFFEKTLPKARTGQQINDVCERVS